MKPKTKTIGGGGVAIPINTPRPSPPEVRALVKAVRHHGATLRPITVGRRYTPLKGERVPYGYMLVSGWLELQAARFLDKKSWNVEAIILEDEQNGTP